MKKLLKEIERGQNLDVNLSTYSQDLFGLYYKEAMVRFCFNYYNFCDTYQKDIRENSDLAPINHILESILFHILRDDLKIEEEKQLLEKINSLRNQIIGVMKNLTAYVDVFSAYQKVLQRKSMNFTEKSLPADYTDKTFTQTIMNYIVQDQDQAAINMRLSEILRELPVRMTKNHFFDLIERNLALYKGSDKKSLDEFLYILKTTASLEFPEDNAKHLPILYRFLEELRSTDFNNLTKESFMDLSERFSRVVDSITKILQVYTDYMSLTNDLYIISASKSASLNHDMDNYCQAIVLATHDQIRGEDEISITREMETAMRHLEGQQELTMEAIRSYEMVLDLIGDQYKETLEELSLKESFFEIQKISLVNSGNHFVEFDTMVMEKEIITDDMLNEVKEDLIRQFTELFKNHDKSYNRAIQAAVLSVIPPFVKNIMETQDYIFTSLQNCKDPAEKQSIYEVISQGIQNGFKEED